MHINYLPTKFYFGKELTQQVQKYYLNLILVRGWCLGQKLIKFEILKSQKQWDQIQEIIIIVCSNTKLMFGNKQCQCQMGKDNV